MTINGIITGIIAYVLQVKGTPLSAGFGYTGLVGPINAFNRMSGDPTMNIILLALGYFVIPFVSAFIVHELCKNSFLYILMIFINLKFQNNNL